MQSVYTADSLSHGGNSARRGADRLSLSIKARPNGKKKKKEPDPIDPFPRRDEIVNS